MRPSLLHRYRCTRLEDLYTEHAAVLQRMTALDALRVLIIGGPGTGKSTLCRVIIASYYGDDVPDNVMHISSLNDQGVHYYRTDVRAFCQTCTRVGKKKMLVLDDMDVMIDSGQQVFLNYMDAFPRILFVVTASAPLKIISGIHSRLLSLRLSPFSTAFLRTELDRIATAEGLEVDPRAADALVLRAGSSMRTLVNALEKVLLLGRGLTVDSVACCSTLDARVAETLSAAIEARDAYAAVDVVMAVHRDGCSVMDIIDAYFSFVKQASLPDERKYAIIAILAKYIVIFNQHEHPIELVFCINDLVDKKIDSST